MICPSSALVDWALYYADLGYRVFPITPGAKFPPLTVHGCLDASSDPDTIEAWWAATPTANIGIAANGLIVIDIDEEQNPWPNSIDRVLDLAACPVSRTPNLGSHHFFRQPVGKAWGNTVSKLGLMVDTRASGGYIVAPPSVFDGRSYAWAETMELEVGPEQLPEPPSWLAAALDAIESMSRIGPIVGTDGNVIPKGQRDNTLAKLAGAMRRTGMGAAEILPALLAVNDLRCKPPLGSRDVQRITKSICRYEPDQITVAVVENHWAQMAELHQATEDPGLIPDELLRVPGFISEVMDYTLETAHYPNVPMAFCGALALQAFLAGRKVRDPGDNRTNIYLLGLAHSSSGKDRPRKVNTEVLHAIGLDQCLKGQFASGEGIQDTLFLQPCTLYQTDEIDTILQALKHGKDGRHEPIMSTLLMMYSSANSVFPMRSKAGKEATGAIDQPCLGVFGTAIPNHYYDALSERMLTNGFFARMLIIECGKRSAGQDPDLRPIPPRVIDAARWWANFRPGTGGNLQVHHPVPDIVAFTPDARALLTEVRLETEAEYDKSESVGDPIGTTVWGRVGEHVRKLALIYAISENAVAPSITSSAIAWGRAIAVRQAKRMLFMAASRVTDSAFDLSCLRFLEKLRESESHEMSHSALLRKMRLEAKVFTGIVQTLEQRGDIVVQAKSTTGRPGRFYALPAGSTQA